MKQIELRLTSSDQLFDTRDPSPFHEKRIDDEASDYISNNADDYSLKTRLLLRLEFAQIKHPEEDIIAAIHTHFTDKMESVQFNLRRLLRLGVKSLGIGLVFLAICTAIGHLIPSDSGIFMEIAKEGLNLIPWVSLWFPINIFLYDWRPYSHELKLYRKLSNIEIIIANGKS